MLTKNQILAIVSAVGLFLTLVGALTGGADAAIILLLITLSCIAGVFFFYEIAGDNCIPTKPDDNVDTWVTNKIGKCVPSKCKTGYFIIDGKCQIPTELPSKWTLETSNTFTDSADSTVSVTSNAVCGYSCYETDGCNYATFDGSSCNLYAKKSPDTSKKATKTALISRPTKS